MERIELPPTYTRAQASEAGLTRSQLRDDGRRVSRNAYVSRGMPLDLHTACLAVQPVLPAGAVFSHGTAGALLGAPVEHRWPVNVTVPPGSYRPRRNRLRTHVRTLGADDVTRHRGLPLTSGAQTWLDLATLLPAGELVAIGDALYRAGHLDAEGLDERIRRAGGTRGVVVARGLAPLLTPQQWKVALEYEGRQHADAEQFGRDVDRYSLMAADGWLLLRFAGGTWAAWRRWSSAPRALSGVAAPAGDRAGYERGQRRRTAFRAARTRATFAGDALGPMSPIRHTEAA